MDKYRYLFPYEKIPSGASVLIYGAGILGQEYFKQMCVTKYCNVIGFIDKNHTKYQDVGVPVIPPDRVREFDFDFIVLAMRTENWIPEIKRLLALYGVSENQIVYCLERNVPEILVGNDKGSEEKSTIFAYETSNSSFALLLSGGIGDMVNHKRFAMELNRFAPDAKIDIYVIQDEKFPLWLYSDCAYVQNVMLDLGVRYSENMSRYNLAISVYGSTFITVDHFQPEKFGNEYKNFVERIELLKKRTEEEHLSLAIPAAVAFYRRIYQGIDCYSWMNYGGAFQMNDYHITIPYLEKYEDEYTALNLGKYITINVGNGSSKDGSKIAKTWPVNRFDETAILFRQKYPNIEVVQIGEKDAVSLKNANRHLVGKDFGLLAYILRGAMFHLDIEGGLVHLASQIGTKCIVLFGPTSDKYFVYGNNINLKRGTCHNCYGLYNEVTKCARGMSEPECMYSITPEFVMEKIDKYLETFSNKRNERSRNRHALTDRYADDTD